jgi:hypothetical protein
MMSSSSTARPSSLCAILTSGHVRAHAGLIASDLDDVCGLGPCSYAITGQNGSRMSSILETRCFVLRLTNTLPTYCQLLEELLGPAVVRLSMCRATAV